jgi:hypothetical protein
LAHSDKLKLQLCDVTLDGDVVGVVGVADALRLHLVGTPVCGAKLLA